MHPTIDRQVTSLGQLSGAALRARYTEVFGETARTSHKTWLVKRIAWRLQALAEGDLSERARKRAAELANDADLRLNPPRSAPVVSSNNASAPSSSQQPDNRLPPAGQTLRRLYKGRMVHVRILPKGFEFEGVMYHSLSAVA